MGVLVEQDLETGAFYLALSDRQVAQTVHVDDLVMVDLDDMGQPVGVEFGAPPTETELALLQSTYPDFKALPALHSLV